MNTLQKLRKYPSEELIKIVESCKPLPEEALFLGYGYDQKPMLLNLYYDEPKFVLVTGDARSGKTDFLKTAAFASAETHSKDRLEFGVLTHNPDEWGDAKKLPNCAGVFSSRGTPSEDFIFGVASWAHSNKARKQHVLLIIDGLETYNQMNPDAQNYFRWILSCGSSRNIRPIISLNSAMLDEMDYLLSSITHAKMIGCIKDRSILDSLSREFSAPALRDFKNSDGLFDFAHFTNGKWVFFWTPGSL